MDAINIAEQPEGQRVRPLRRGCIASGCTCKDVCFVSQRRARFYAHQAGSRGQTAQRAIAPDADWRIPLSA